VQKKVDARNKSGAQMTAALQYTAVDDMVIEILGADNPMLTGFASEDFGEDVNTVSDSEIGNI
jgi:hypothetical protein